MENGFFPFVIENESEDKKKKTEYSEMCFYDQNL